MEPPKATAQEAWRWIGSSSSQDREVDPISFKQQADGGNAKRAEVAPDGAPVVAQLVVKRQAPKATAAVSIIEPAVEVGAVRRPQPHIEPLGDRLPGAPGELLRQLLGRNRLAKGKDVLFEVVAKVKRISHR